MTARRERGHLSKVEGELRGIERLARTFAEPDTIVTPTEMWEIMVASRRALRSLGLNFPHPVRDVPQTGEVSR